MSKKRVRKHHAKKCVYEGIEFDSLTERDFYIELLGDPNVKTIELQPAYKIIDDYVVACRRCRGTGKLVSDKTGNPINCTLCSGNKQLTRTGARYTADFKVTYNDGYVEIIDVKGWRAERDFSLRKKLYEVQSGVELIVVRRKGKGWTRS